MGKAIASNQRLPVWKLRQAGETVQVLAKMRWLALAQRLLAQIPHRPMKTTCQCDLCQKWGPLIRRIRRKLRGKDLLLFNEYVNKEMSEADDLACANAKLAGSWPGWGWMVEAVKEHKKEL